MSEHDPKTTVNSESEDDNGTDTSLTPTVDGYAMDDEGEDELDLGKQDNDSDTNGESGSDNDEESSEENSTPQPAPHSLNTTQDFDVYVAVPKHLLKLDPIIVTARRNSRMTADVQSWHIDKNDLTDKDLKSHAERALYGHRLVMGESFTENDFFTTILDDEESDWGQNIPFDNKLIEQKYARPKDVGSGQTRRLTGAAAKQRVSSLLGLGITTRVPLVHSGFHIELSARSAAEVMSLDVALHLDKVKAGNESSGIIFQNSQYAVVEKIFNFIMESTTSANVLNYTDLDLADLIRVTDLPLLYRAMGEVFYPDGYVLELTCSADPVKCRHVEQVNLNIGKTVWYNRSALSSAQKAHLLKVRHNFTEKEIEEYQNIGKSSFSKSVPVTASNGRKIEVLLRVPTVAQYLASGRDFVASAQNALEVVLLDREMNDDQRREFVEQQMNMNLLREYGHWIEAVVIEKTDRIEGTDDVNNALNSMSADVELSKQIFAEIQTFIEESTMAIVAIPNHSCRACQKDYETETSKLHPELVPIDALKLFFELKDRRLQYQD